MDVNAALASLRTSQYPLRLIFRGDHSMDVPTLVDAAVHLGIDAEAITIVAYHLEKNSRVEFHRFLKLVTPPRTPTHPHLIAAVTLHEETEGYAAVPWFK